MDLEADGTRSDGVEKSRAQPGARLRLTIRRAMVAVAFLGIFLGPVKFLFIDNSPTDVLISAIDSLAGQSTVYPEGFSESKFRSIRPGMTVRQVEDIMGQPLRKGRWMDSGGSGPITPGQGIEDELWYYSRAGKARGNYWRRAIWYRDGIVVKTDRTYYID